MPQTSCPSACKCAPVWIVRLCTALWLCSAIVFQPCVAVGSVQKGPFYVEDDRTPSARIVRTDRDAIHVGSFAGMDDFFSSTRDLIGKQKQGRLEGSAVAKAWTFFNDALGFSANAFTFFTQADSTLGSSVSLVVPKGRKLMEFVSESPRLYPSIVYDEASMGKLVLKQTTIGKIGDAFKTAGLVVLAVQTALFIKDAAVGKEEKEDFFNIVKGIGYNAVTLFGSAGLQLGSVGVFAIDYALNEFGKEAMRLHKEGIGKIYREYTLGKRSMTDWENRLWSMMEKLAANKHMDRFDVVLDREVENYCLEFWKDGDSPLHTLKLEKYPSEKEREELTAEVTAEMQVEIRRRLARGGVFRRLQERLVSKMQDDLAKRVDAAAKLLNAEGVFRVETSKTRSRSAWSGCTVWIYPDGGERKLSRKWSFTLTDKGTGHLKFTLLGFFQHDFPTKAVIFGPGKMPGKDEPMVKCLFRMGFPDTKLVLPEKEEEAESARQRPRGPFGARPELILKIRPGGRQ